MNSSEKTQPETKPDVELGFEYSISIGTSSYPKGDLEFNMITEIDTDIPHIVKMKIMFVGKIKYWKVLIDTGAHCKDECNTSFSSPI